MAAAVKAKEAEKAEQEKQHFLATYDPTRHIRPPRARACSSPPFPEQHNEAQQTRLLDLGSLELEHYAREQREASPHDRAERSDMLPKFMIPWTPCKCSSCGGDESPRGKDTDMLDHPYVSGICPDVEFSWRINVEKREAAFRQRREGSNP
jgi:hypothetical protein